MSTSWMTSLGLQPGALGPEKDVRFDTLNASVRNIPGAPHSLLTLAVGARLAEGKEVIHADVSNPHAAGQHPLTFVRQVLALCLAPFLLSNPNVSEVFPVDAMRRAQEYLASAAGAGAADPKGCLCIRQDVAQYISEDIAAGHAGLLLPVTSPDQLFLCNGASECVHLLMQALLRGSNDVVLLPSPGSGLYSASVALHGGTAVSYPLLEDAGWAVDVTALWSVVRFARERGLVVRAMVLINPGSCGAPAMSAAGIAQVLGFCQQNGIAVIADEVYRNNLPVRSEVAATDSFVSARRVMAGCEGAMQRSLQLFSINSVSKGVMAEGALRGGYLEAVNVDHGVLTVLRRLAGARSAPNLAGQVAVGLLARPPAPEDPSFESHSKEVASVLVTMRERNARVVRVLSSMRGVRCSDGAVEAGAPYCYPAVLLPAQARAEALAAGLSLDEYYCVSLLAETGILVQPGSELESEDPAFDAGAQRRVHLKIATASLLPEGRGEDLLDRFASFHDRFMDAHGSTDASGARDGAVNYLDIVLSYAKSRAKL